MLIRLLIGLLLGAASLCHADETDAKTRLLKAVHHADHLVIKPSDMLPPTAEIGPDAILFEIKGAANIQNLVQSLEFKPAPDTYAEACLCGGTHIWEFYSVDRFKFQLSLHHYQSFRGGFGGPWYGDAVLTEAGSDSMIEWFADHGFTNFKEEKAQIAAYVAKRKAEREQIAGLFPEKVRAWVLELSEDGFGDDQIREKIEAEVASSYDDQSQLVRVVWSALGMSSRESEVGTLYISQGPPRFFRGLLDKVSRADINRALSNLPSTDSAAWLGALLHYDSLGSEDKLQWGKEWPVRLIEHYLNYALIYRRYRAIALLGEMDTPEAKACLLKIATEPRAEPSKINVVSNGSFSPPMDLPDDIVALYFLAQKKTMRARELIEAKLESALDEQDRLILEIALTNYDDSMALEKQHLRCDAFDGDAAERAWTLLRAAEGEIPSLDLLSAAARSPSFTVRNEAEAILRKYGLKSAEVRSEREDFRSVIDSNLRGLEAIEACTALLVKGQESPKRDLLYARRGDAYLSMGEYEKGRLDLEKADTENMVYNLALAAFGAGRLGQADELAWYNSRKNADSSKFLEMRGCLNYVLDQFAVSEELFTASYIAGAKYRRLIFRHLALLQIGAESRSPLLQWVPDWESSGPLMPNDLIYYLQDKLDLSVLLKNVASSYPSERVGNLSLVYWTLSQVARAKANLAAERGYLEQCIEAEAFLSLTHVMALARLQVLDEMVAE